MACRLMPTGLLYGASSAAKLRRIASLPPAGGPDLIPLTRGHPTVRNGPRVGGASRATMPL